MNRPLSIGALALLAVAVAGATQEERLRKTVQEGVALPPAEKAGAKELPADFPAFDPDFVFAELSYELHAE